LATGLHPHVHRERHEAALEEEACFAGSQARYAEAALTIADVSGVDDEVADGPAAHDQPSGHRSTTREDQAHLALARSRLDVLSGRVRGMFRTECVPKVCEIPEGESALCVALDFFGRRPFRLRGWRVHLAADL